MKSVEKTPYYYWEGEFNDHLCDAIIQEGNTKTFIRCGAYKDRPYQSDNLHIDIWIDGNNVLRDNGSYQYNTSKELINYFNGSKGHNTISIDGKDQMQKGDRFIWNYWIKYAKANLTESQNKFVFNGEIKGFKHLDSNILYQRIVTKSKGLDEWIVKDIISGLQLKLGVRIIGIPFAINNPLVSIMYVFRIESCKETI